MEMIRESNKQIKYGAIISYIAILFNIVSGLLYTPWMINKIGQSEYGLFSLAITLISFFSIDFGLGEAVSRFLSKYNAENKIQEKKDFLGITFKLYIVIDIVIFIILMIVYIFAGKIYAELTVDELSKFRVAFLIAAVYSVCSFPFMPLNGIIISHERFTFRKFTDLLHKIITVVMMIIVLLLGYRLYSLVIVNAISGVITILLKLSYIHKNKLIEINFRAKNRTILREIFGFSFWTTLMIVAQRFILNITPTVLGAFAGSVQISLFSVAMAIEGYTWTFANALNGLFLPKVTRITIRSNNSHEIENLMIKVGRIQLMLVGLLIIGFIIMGKEFMILWMGESFSVSYYVTILLILPCIITLTQDIANTTLVALNKIRYRAYAYITVAVISFSLSVVLSRKWGAIGSGIAIFIGNVIGHVILMNIVYNKVLKINIFRFFKENHIKMCVPLILFAVVASILQYFFPAKSMFLFLVKVCILCVIYFILMWNTALNDYEKNLFSELLNKIFQVFGRKLNVQR